MFHIFSHKPKAIFKGCLPELDGHKIYFQVFGNPNGKTILNFHGGPGARSKFKYVRCCNLKRYKVIIFDQRGCGNSEFKDLFYKNTTQDTIKDAKRILDFLNIKEKVISFGGSWGSTLALLFAETYPDLVDKIIVSQTFLARKKDVDWTYKDSKMFYPDIIEKLSPYLINTHKDLENLLKQSNVKIKKTVKYLTNYDYQIGKLKINLDEELGDSTTNSFKVYMHYNTNNYFIKENEILNNIAKIKNIPTLIIGNRLDFCTPLEQAYTLHKAMPKSTLHIIDSFGHGSKKQNKLLPKLIKEFLG